MLCVVGAALCLVLSVGVTGAAPIRIARLALQEGTVSAVLLRPSPSSAPPRRTPTPHPPPAAAALARLPGAGREPVQQVGPPDPPPPPQLLSLHRPATADVRGNLGPASVVTSEVVEDWLADRWQAAGDMSGTPLPGPHWVEVDLGGPAHLTSILLDWEDAHATDWTLSGKAGGAGEEGDWVELARGPAVPVRHVAKWHVLQEVPLPPRDGGGGGGGRDGGAIRTVRLTIHSPATQWGASLWRLQVWGHWSLLRLPS